MAVLGLASEQNNTRPATYLQNNRRQYFRTFFVRSDSQYDSPNLIRTAPGLPAPYAMYITATDFDPGARVVRIEPRRSDKNAKLWFVDVDYDTEFERKDGNPFLETPKIEYDFESFKLALPGKPVQSVTSYGNSGDGSTSGIITHWGGGITNSAGEPFDPPPEIEASRPVVTFTRNEPSFSTAIAVKFINSVNRDPWNALEQRTAMLKGIKAHLEVRKTTTFNGVDIPYFPVTYQFVLRRETWDLQLLNIGTYYLSAAATFDSDGNVTNSVAKIPFLQGGNPTKGLLKLDGTKVTDGVPTYRRYRVYKEESFAALNIVLNFTGI